MKTFRVLFILSSVILLSSCSTPTKYGPNPKPALGYYGYSEVREDSITWEVTFAGNYQTPRQVVEQYALYRAAELTSAAGFDYFVVLRTKNMTELLGKRREPSSSLKIRMHAGARPMNNSNAYDAKEMLGTMSKSIERSN
jgi:hypothetical protein